MHLILTGATGLVGSGVLDAMIKMKDISKISIISRRPVQMAEDAKDPRINVIIHKDFESYDSDLLSKLKGATGCVWALGISQTQVGKEEYVKITKDYALAASTAFQTLASEQEPFNFVYISGGGTTTQPGMFTALFARVKGETELALAEMRKVNPLFHGSSIRAAFIDAAKHDAIKSYIPTQTFAIKATGATLGPLIRCGMPQYWSPTADLGRFVTEMAMGKYKDQLKASNGIQMEGEFPILENSAFRRLAGLDRK
ncbi:putative nucleoside-diphosphate-sugar epimerase [Annulohypoxylon maeteangense]|uniref:putative nucleoside-diphosphate-sugar epimerase n=1 Tax=Annulohypoxylon maeteangense TaxID=1927788 RepID=UPI0020081E79|nr:putative nucleoside-diphosphate-sugar epimerase [Annulohypoxylon maeteangense]KAI0880580.1 putative nucleoside-diphosphate-sugar epimerase [Annulohypoxylon maeteangense]